MSASASVPQLASSPTTLFFGAVGVGRTETQLITVTNTGQTSTTVSEITVNNSQFTVSNLNLPLVLSAGQSFDLSVTFTPSAIEWTGGRIRIANSGDPMGVEIAGTGVSSQTLTANPTSLSFGQVATGSSATLPVTITNGRSFSVTLEGMQSADSEFSVKGPSLPLILAAGQSATFSVTFTPQSTGQVGGNLALFWGLRLSIPLIGTGTTVAPGQLSVAPAPLNFGSVAVGSTTTKPITLSASGASVTISSAASNTSQFALQGMSFPLTIPVGQPVSFNVAFTPQNSGTESGTLSFTSNASNSTTSESLSGTGTTVAPGQLSVAPAPLNFGSVAVGSTTTKPITLSASGASVTISSAASNTSQFALQGMSFPLTIPVGQPVSFNVAFTPQNSGTESGTLSFTSNASNSTTSESLSGTGTTVAPGQLSVAPAPLNFGSVAVGSTTTQPITLSASGASVTISSAASSTSQFALQGMSFPLTIPVGQPVSLNVAFTPQNSGTQSGTLSFTSNASKSTTSESLSGTGTVTSYSVNLYWNSSSDVAGYNVYRSASANGTYAKINPSLNATTAYTDSTVVSGQTYYYEATAVSSSGMESARSTPAVQAVVP